MLDWLVGLQMLPGTCWRNLKGPGVLWRGLVKQGWILNLGVKDAWFPLLLWWPDGLSSKQIPACHSSPPPCLMVCVLSLNRMKAQRHLQVLVLRREEQPWPQSHLRDPFAWEMGSFTGYPQNQKNTFWLD